MRATESFEVDDFLADVNTDSLHEKDTSLQMLRDDSGGEERSSQRNSKVSYINVKQAKKVSKIVSKISKKLRLTFGLDNPEKEPERKPSGTSTKSKSIVITL